MRLLGGIDFSKYQAGVTVDAIRQAIQSQGGIVTIQAYRNDGPNEYCGAQLLKSKQAGAIDLSIYVLLNYEAEDNGDVQVQKALAEAAKGIDTRELLFVAIDVEPYPSLSAGSLPWRIPRVLEAVAEVKRRGLHPIIYTNKGAWETVMSGTPQSWGDVVGQTQVWYAHPNQPNFDDAWAAVPWPPASIVGKQYDSNNWGGFDFDQNIWLGTFIDDRRLERDTRLTPPPPPPPPIIPPLLPDPEIEMLKSRVLVLEGLVKEIETGLNDAQIRLYKVNSDLVAAGKALVEAAKVLVKLR